MNADYLKRLRENRGLSQAQLAKQVGMSKRTLQALEQGQRSINGVAAVTLYTMAKVLQCEIEDLLDLDDVDGS